MTTRGIAMPAAHRRRSHRLAGAAVAASALLLLGTACSGGTEKRAFTVPSDLCGTPVPTDVLEPVLPAGGDVLRAEPETDRPGNRQCKVTVDGTTVLSAFAELRADPSVAKVARGNPYMDLDEHTGEDGTYTWSEQGGVHRIACPALSAEHPDRGHMFVRVLLHDEELSDADAAKELVLAYAKSVAASKECTGGA